MIGGLRGGMVNSPGSQTQGSFQSASQDFFLDLRADDMGIFNLWKLIELELGREWKEPKL